MKPARLVVVIVVGVVLVAGALVFMGSTRSSRIADFRKEAESKAAYKRADVYLKGTDEEKKYVDDLFKYAADVASNNLNGFFSPPPDEKKYYVALYQAMIDQAKQQGKADLARSFRGWVNGQGYGEVQF